MEGEGEATGENDNSTQVHHLGANARILVNEGYAGFWNDWIQIDMFFLLRIPKYLWFDIYVLIVYLWFNIEDDEDYDYDDIDHQLVSSI